MIGKTLTFLRDQIQTHLDVKLKPGGQEKAVKIKNIVDPQGKTVVNNEICLTLIGVEEEKVHKVQSPYKTINDQTFLVNPEIKLNLYVLLTSYSQGEGNYEDSLNFLSHAISFFHSRQVFNHQNSPSLDERIHKLIMELVTLSFEEQNHLWGFVGGKYIPSVLYKVRLLTVVDESIQHEAQKIQIINANLLQQ